MMIVCAGDAGIDRYHREGGYEDFVGGCAVNVAAGMRAALPAHHDVRVLGAIGDDDVGMAVVTSLADLGVSSLLSRLPGRTACQEIRVDSDGEKNFVGYQAGVLPSHICEAGQEAAVAAADVVTSVLFSQNEAWLRRLLALPRRGRLVIDFMSLADFDFSLERVEPFLVQADLAVFGLSPANGSLIGELTRRAEVTGRSILVTLGSQGSLLLDGSRRYMAEAPPVAKVVDTTGAGDAYLAAFLASNLMGADPATAMDVAHRAAARVVGRLGPMLRW